LGAAHEASVDATGEVKVIYWQAPSIMNPYLSGGTKDLEAREPRARTTGPL